MAPPVLAVLVLAGWRRAARDRQTCVWSLTMHLAARWVIVVAVLAGSGAGLPAQQPTTPVDPAWGHSGFFPGYQTALLWVSDPGISLAIQINTSAPRATGTRSLLRVLIDIAAIVKASGHAPARRTLSTTC
jgi:hypothetical protein